MKQNSNKQIELKSVKIDGESYFEITNHNEMPPFFMSIVSDSNHWMFISSNGGLTAGRRNAEYALFPYYTDDKIAESYDVTGSKSLFWVTKNAQSRLWEPFSERDEASYNFTRNLYKGVLGNKILFEEINHDLGLTFRYKWSSSNQFGFVKESCLINNSDDEVSVRSLDGIQNIVPQGVSSDLQAIRSNLVDAYKRNELDEDSGLGIYALSAIIVDRAEPSEALKANIAWSIGLESPTYLLSSSQIKNFRNGDVLTQERDIKAAKGAYFVEAGLSLLAHSQSSWMIIANVNQGPSDVVAIADSILSSQNLVKQIKDDILLGDQNLVKLVSAADGAQLSSEPKQNARHYSNTLFNIMRGGIFDQDYTIEKADFNKYLQQANRSVYQNAETILANLPNIFTYQEIKKAAVEYGDPDFTRLAIEYLPLKFSRRHGDPSRPWNRFSINTRNEIDGSKVLDYEGNWRDIFQNWEALAHSYPDFIEGMIFKFLNATTFDGYNPYRVTKGGFDWEVIEPNDPWSYIGYWGDHQIIYLLKFLEFIEDYFPGRIESYLDKELFVYANVPYRIKSYADILENPKDTILFDGELDESIRRKRDQIGADGALLGNADVLRVNLTEKLLATLLAKLSNFIPGGGIWMNTQRPEWNDANNALVGNGVSMVTLYYLRRYCDFLLGIMSRNTSSVPLSKNLHTFYSAIRNVFTENESSLISEISDEARKQILDGLGKAGSIFRDEIYEDGFASTKEMVSLKDLHEFMKTVIRCLDHTIELNERSDGMYHGYNLMSVVDKSKVNISRLDEMLEGQVAVLSSGYLSAKQSLDVLDSLKASKLFRADQYSYILYPYKQLEGFLKKNSIDAGAINRIQLLKTLSEAGNTQILEQDVRGNYHFNGSFNNVDSLKEALEGLPDDYVGLKQEDYQSTLDLFEEVFNHKAFTGRSGTFYGYEGLGSIYWHMVSKLLLAVMEICQKAIAEGESEELIGRLLEHLYEINEGIGTNKSPELYGAFPVDPYSHTPATKGAQQPGMTGQVKEDILSRRGELGVQVKAGTLSFEPNLLRKEQFLTAAGEMKFYGIDKQPRILDLKERQLAFTICQTPVIYQISNSNGIEVKTTDGKIDTYDTLSLDLKTSKLVFERSGAIDHLLVSISSSYLK
ncbi:MAG: hypothetical protein JXQ90_14835 [Cyclobacteriaceae bacterium]